MTTKLPTKFQQADGTVTERVVPLSNTQYAAGVVFTPSETKAPATAETNSIVVYDNFDGTHHQLKSVGGAKIDSNGVVDSEVIFNNIIDKSTAGETQPVIANPGNVNITIDLALGTTIRLTHDENITITFTNIPVGMVTPVVIDRKKADNTTPRTISFTHTVKVEGRQKLAFSNAANSRDMLFMYIKGGEIYARMPILNFAQTTGSIATTTSYDAILPDLKVSRAANENTIVSITSGGNFITTDVEWDGSTFITPINSVKNTVALMYFPLESKTASDTGVVEFDASAAIYGELLLDANVTSFNILNTPEPNLLTYTLFVKHGPAANIYDIDWTTDFKYDTRPALTQDPNAEDMIVITTIEGGNKVVHCYQNFGVTL